MPNTLSNIQGLVYRNESSLYSRLAAWKPLQEAFDSALTGGRCTLAALDLELDKLVKPKDGHAGTQCLDFKQKPKLVRKEAIMKQLLDKMQGQLTLLYLSFSVP